jgi:IclR family transcriptional regulator, acetate operon repressor
MWTSFSIPATLFSAFAQRVKNTVPAKIFPRRATPKSSAPTEEKEIGSVRAVDRAIDILQCFTPHKPLMSVIEIQERVGLSRPTLYRLLQTLTGKGLVLSEGDPQRFRLAHGVMKLAHVWLAGMNIIAVARPLLETLRDQSSETAALFVSRGTERLCVLECPSRHALAISRGVGDTGHITQGASGKAILAFLDRAERNAIIEAAPPCVDTTRLAKELDITRRKGFSISRGEVFAGAVAIAAPFFGMNGSVWGSVGLFGPSARLTDARIVDLLPTLVSAALEISVRNGAPASSVGTKDPLR